MTVKEEHLHFSIAGWAITSLARNFWIEDKEDKAISFLMESLPGLTEEQSIQICTGKMKLTGKNNLYFKKDNTTTHRGIKLLSLTEVLCKKTQKLATITQERDDVVNLFNQPDYIASPEGLLAVPPMVKRAIREGKLTFKDKFVCRNIFTGYNPLPIDEESEPESTESIEPDPTLSALNGWISPDGKFYPCPGYGQHEDTADRLGHTGGELEKEGWIKIQDNQDERALKDIGCISWNMNNDRLTATQAQIDTVFGWCQKHNCPMPECPEPN